VLKAGPPSRGREALPVSAAFPLARTGALPCRGTADHTASNPWPKMLVPSEPGKNATQRQDGSVLPVL
jgi:hypothetical protein